MKRILVSVDRFEARAVLLDGDHLLNIEVESATTDKKKGGVYKGRVISVEHSIEAAFVDIGVGKDGFLPFDEISKRSLERLSKKGQGSSEIKEGDWVLVQVVKEEIGKKGVSLSMNISIPGRFIVLLPFSDKAGVSRKINGEERQRLKGLTSKLRIPESFGVIIRTAGEKEEIEELQSDLDYQYEVWKLIEERFQDMDNPGRILADVSLPVRFVRDYMSSDVKEVLVEDENSYKELLEFMTSRMPSQKNTLKLYNDPIPLFSRYGVERQIESLLSPTVSLQGGGSIIISQTEALTAIDVNSGKIKEGRLEKTAFYTNIEAAKEIARQVILRDLGGIFVVDFIDMESEEHRKMVENALREAFANDKAKVNIGTIGDFGLLTFSRQRLRQTMDVGLTEICSACCGKGRVKSVVFLGLSTIRKIKERLTTLRGMKPSYVEVKVPIQVANFINNRKRTEIAKMEEQWGVIIDVVGVTENGGNEGKITVLPEVPEGRYGLWQTCEHQPEDKEKRLDLCTHLEETGQTKRKGIRGKKKFLDLSMADKNAYLSKEGKQTEKDCTNDQDTSDNKRKIGKKRKCTNLSAVSEKLNSLGNGYEQDRDKEDIEPVSDGNKDVFKKARRRSIEKYGEGK